MKMNNGDPLDLIVEEDEVITIQVVSSIRIWAIAAIFSKKTLVRNIFESHGVHQREQGAWKHRHYV
jgi:hypothetical protein